MNWAKWAELGGKVPPTKKVNDYRLVNWSAQLKWAE